MDLSGLIFGFCLSLGGITGIFGQRLCPRLQKPWNGAFIGQCSRNVGSQCVMKCREPYILVGSQVRTCRADGTWSGSTTACQLDGCENCGGGSGSNCPNLYEPTNGHTSGQCTPGIAGQTCEFQCLSGYELEGQPRLTCLSSGQWSSTAPFCSRRSAAICEAIVVANGYVSCSEQGGLTVCSVTCNAGYMIVGSSVITCSSSGVWNEQVPSCRSSGIETSSVCPTLVAPSGGRLVGSCRAATTGDTCQLVCLSGYRPTETRILICQTTGRWSNSLPRCIGDTGSDSFCPTLLPPASGSLSGICGPGQLGQSCNFYCNSGYELVGQSTLVCGSNGQWSGNVPYCRGETCPNLIAPANGLTSGSCSQAVLGQACTFTCQAGYTLTGQSTLYCQEGGRWSAAAPTCTRSQASVCASLVPPAFGFMIGTCAPGRVGETCVFGCDEGYTLRGQRTLTCQSTSLWSSFTPVCERTGEPGELGTCPVLVPPPNGEFLECDNRPGGQCIVVCQTGYIRSGSRVRTCLTQGTWSGYSPTCTRTVGYTTYTYKVVPLWSLIFG